MALEEDLKAYYQVPSKPLAEFNITNDKVYTLTLNENDVDINFGNLAALSAVPLASTTRIGGFRLYKESDGSGTATVSLINKQYAVLLRDTDSVGFVYVPWLNTLYQAAPTGYLCAECISEANGHDGGLFYFDISCVPVTLISGAGNMLSGEYSDFDHISALISEPLSGRIDGAILKAANDLTDHEALNATAFENVYTSVDNLSNDLENDFYRKNETSSDSLINALFVALSNNFIDYLNNELEPYSTNPAYLCSETSSKVEIANKFNELSDAAIIDFINKDEGYLRNLTSSDVELKEMFDTKQDMLSVHNEIDKNRTDPYTVKDIATVEAITSYIKAELSVQDAIYKGYFNSLSAIPTISSGYIHPTQPPDKNDYIIVNVTEDDIDSEYNVFQFTDEDCGVWRLKIPYSWDESEGLNNWEKEYKIRDSAFTENQINALNSGITEEKVKDILDYDSLCDKLKRTFPNLTAVFGKLAYLDLIAKNIIGEGTAGQLALFKSANELTSLQFTPVKEEWSFELQDGTIIKKNMLVENLNDIA